MNLFSLAGLIVDESLSGSIVSRETVTRHVALLEARYMSIEST